jgi:hypothetical protein
MPSRQRSLTCHPGRGFPGPPFGLPVTGVGWVGFQNQVQTEPLTFGDTGQCPGVLEPKCHNGATYVAMLVECDLVNVVCYHVVCYTTYTLTGNRTKVSQR